MIYLDAAATVKPRREVIEVVRNALEREWYNPSARYAEARQMRQHIETARITIAESIGARPDEIYFTSSGSEANAMAIKGVTMYVKDTVPCVSSFMHMPMTSAIEHKSIMDWALDNNFTIIPVNKDGKVSPDIFSKMLEEYNPRFVSIQYVNNETGSENCIQTLAELAHKHNCIFHTDAVQAFQHCCCDVKKLGVDAMSFSGHKIGCPPGIGFLYLRHGLHIEPLINGSQEYGYRGGTENLPYILGLAEAVKHRYDIDSENIRSNRIYFEKALIEIGCKINCYNTYRAPHIISCMLPEGVMADYMMNVLELDGIKVSAGSACNTGKPSRVLKAIGLLDDGISRTIRISMDETITSDIIDYVVDCIEGRIKQVRCLINVL